MVQLPTQRSSVAIDPRRRAAHHFGHARARTSGNGASASSNLSSSAIDQLLIAPYADESHPHVAVRAHLLASEVPIRRTVLLTQKPGRNGPQEDLLTVANASDLVLIGRRTMFPWLVPYLGRHARRILRRTRTPVLVIGRKPRRAYRRVIIAADLHTDIRAAWFEAKRIAPRASFTFLHVYRALMDGKLQWAGVTEDVIAKYRFGAQREAAQGMAALLHRHGFKSGFRTLLTYGSPISDVPRRARELDADLLVVVRNNHSWWADFLGASHSLEIAMRAECDVLVVHQPPATAPVSEASFYSQKLAV
jgi:nucleotide-binding universal stress UspA family protein